MSADPLRWIDAELNALEDLFLRRRLQVRESPQSGHRIVIDGTSFINFGSNDYLGFAQRLHSAECQETVGWGSGASPLVSGRGSDQAALEAELAEFEGTEAALLFPSGYAANLGTIAAIVDKGDVVFSDAKNHASIIDGCRLSRARIQVYPHNDVDYLRMMLRQTASFRRRLIVTDGLFSMDGDLAPLDQIQMLAEEHDAMLMVDEAHGTGVFGSRGNGVCEHFGIERSVSIRVGTMSKAMGASGGFVIGSQALIDWLANTARSFVFSTGSPDGAIRVARTALQMMHEKPRGEHLLAIAQGFREQLQAKGWDVAGSQSQIIPLLIGDPQCAIDLAQQVRNAGCFVPAIRPPTVPQGESLLRVSLTLDHTSEDLQQLVDVLPSGEQTAESRLR